MTAKKPLSPAQSRAPAARIPAVSAEAVQSWLSVVRAFHQCDAVIQRRLAGLGLRLGEHEILVNLLLEPRITQQQLAQRCFSAKSGVSMLASRMEQAGLLTRSADAVDARVWRLALTADGQALAERAHALQLEVVGAMVEGTSEADLRCVTAAMQRASAALTRLRQADAG